MKPPTDIEEAAAKVGIPVSELEDIGQRMSRGEGNSADRDILRGLVPDQKRPCGDCDFCCSAPAIEANVLNDDPDSENFPPKAACQRCQFANGKGCGIYENRPGVCKDYLCLWALGMVPAVNYPMKRGVCWTFQPVEGSPGAVIVMGHATDCDALLSDDYNLRVIGRFITMGKSDGSIHGVVIRDDKHAVCFRLDGTGSHAPIDQSDPMKMRVQEEQERTFDFDLENQ